MSCLSGVDNHIVHVVVWNGEMWHVVDRVEIATLIWIIICVIRYQLVSGARSWECSLSTSESIMSELFEAVWVFIEVIDVQFDIFQSHHHVVFHDASWFNFTLSIWVDAILQSCNFWWTCAEIICSDYFHVAFGLWSCNFNNCGLGFLLYWLWFRCWNGLVYHFWFRLWLWFGACTSKEFPYLPWLNASATALLKVIKELSYQILFDGLSDQLVLQFLERVQGFQFRTRTFYNR